MSGRSVFGPPCTARASEGRWRFGAWALLGGLVCVGCGGLLAEDDASGDDLPSDGSGGPSRDRDSDESRSDDDAPPEGDVPGDEGTVCSCGASPAVLVLETPGGSYEFTEPPAALLYPSFDFGCAAPGPAYVPAACDRRATVAACNEQMGCVLLAAGSDGAEPQLTWYDPSATSVTQVRGNGEVVIEVRDEAFVAGYFNFGDDTGVTHSGKFTVCPVTVRACE